MNATETIHLSTMLGTYPKTKPLKERQILSPLVTLDIAPVDTAQKAFKDVVRGLKYDVAELAIVTFLQAYEAGKPYRLLPFVMNGMFHHKSILCRAGDDLEPEALAGKTIAMRSYAQTTPTWVRGILCDEYGLDLQSVKWLSQEGAHVAEYTNPSWVTQQASSLGLEDMLLAGQVDAIIAGGALSGDPGIRTLIDEPKEAALRWHERTGAVPINHIVAIKEDVLGTSDELVREVFRMLCESRAASGDQASGTGVDMQPIGFDKLKASLEAAIRYAFEQKLILKRYTVDELYGRVADILS
ncbi:MULTISPECIES: phosphate ABC transporter substrate-binding protein [unclassified Caballeronia]|uniref:phosphate ABC transporter substrate-binding protein n=1 Tax=unclassified Caballeronia TaxID=2646786 RepID=UPI00286175F5|nr:MULTISPECIES: phosphate ABC transporter substrate-binding protein [unclassified Caballeronia]MDR5752470.1 phosphate ABC transporter substrate-binding protein [Caballeronia sp. LZ024]MDR5845276.1 phosphate ABC transporter substrate-binding protein [Caballeronia sp. LZ031]